MLEERLAYRTSLPCPVPPGGVAVVLVDGRVAEEHSVQGEGLLKGDRWQQRSTQVEAVLFPTTTWSLSLDVENLRTAEGVTVGLSVQIILRLKDPPRFVRHVVRDQERLEKQDLIAFLTPPVRAALAHALRSCTLDDLFAGPDLRGRLSMAIEAYLRDETDLLGRAGLTLEGVEAFNVYCEVQEQVDEARERWYLHATLAHVEAQGRRILDERLLQELRQHLPIKEALVAYMRRMAALDAEQQALERRLQQRAASSRLSRPEPTRSDGPAAGGFPTSLYRLFCPRCHALCLGNTCLTCGWQREASPTQQRLPIPEQDRIGIREGANIGVSPNALVIATRDGRLLVLDRFTLEVRNQVTLSNLDPRLQDLQVTPGSAIAVDEHHIYLALSVPHPFGPQAGSLVALNANDPSQVAWVLPLRGRSVAAAAVWEGVVHVASDQTAAWAIDGRTQQRVWGPRPLPGWSPHPPALDEDLVIFPARGNRVVALDRVTGRERWSFQAPTKEGAWPFANTPTMAGGRVYLAGWDGCLYCLDRETGKELWTYRAESGQGFLTSPVVTEVAVLMGGRDHLLHAVTPDGEPLWTYDLGRAVYSRPLVLGQEVYVAGDDRRLHALDLRTGVPLWDRPLDLGEKVQVALATDGWHIIAVGRKGSVWRVPRAFPHVLDPEQHLQRGEYELAAVAYGLAGDFAAAGEICELRLGAIDAAVALYLEEGTKEAVARARDLARQVGGWEREAEVLAAAGRYREAGDVVRVRAEQREAATRGRAEGELAELFARAARYYAQAGLEETEEPRRMSEAKVRYYRHLPDLQVIYEEATFPLGEVNPLRIRVINVGRGEARKVHVEIVPDVKGALRGKLVDGPVSLRPRGGTWEPKLTFEPVKPGRITSRCVVTYEDVWGREHTREEPLEVRVMRPDVKKRPVFNISGGSTVYYSEGDMNIVQGDLLQDQAQKGDRVAIQRASAHMRTCPRCGALNVPGARYCEQCRADLTSSGNG